MRAALELGAPDLSEGLIGTWQPGYGTVNDADSIMLKCAAMPCPSVILPLCVH